MPFPNCRSGWAVVWSPEYFCFHLPQLRVRALGEATKLDLSSETNKTPKPERDVQVWATNSHPWQGLRGLEDSSILPSQGSLMGLASLSEPCCRLAHHLRQTHHFISPRVTFSSCLSPLPPSARNRNFFPSLLSTYTCGLSFFSRSILRNQPDVYMVRAR